MKLQMNKNLGKVLLRCVLCCIYKKIDVGFLAGTSVKELAKDMGLIPVSGRCGFNPWVGKIPWRRPWQPTPVFLPGESQGWWSMMGCHLWDSIESDKTEAT